MSVINLVYSRSRAVPAEHRANFIHLVLDIGWFGVLNGSAIAFVAVYATRLGATPLQIGLLNASPAVVNLILALPSGRWLEHKPVSSTVFTSSILHRLFYIPWIVLPWFLGSQGQIQALILLTLLMSIPGTVLGISFNALFAAAVPQSWRGEVAGVRNALFALTSIGTSLLCGWLMTNLPFAASFQVVFAIGAFGALMSSVHLWFVRPLLRAEEAEEVLIRPRNLLQPQNTRYREAALTVPGLRLLMRLGGISGSLPDRRYLGLVGLLFLFHFAQHLSIPLFPLYWVRELRLTDGTISLGNGLFYGALFVGALAAIRLSRRLGFQRVLALGMVTMSLYPAVTAVTRTVPVFLAASAIGGLSWSLVSVALANYLLEQTPPDRRPAYLAWYILALHAGILSGSLLGPLLSDASGIITALLVSAVARAGVGLFFWFIKADRLGRRSGREISQSAPVQDPDDRRLRQRLKRQFGAED